MPRSTGAFKPSRGPVLSLKDVRLVTTCGCVSSFHIPAQGTLCFSSASLRGFQQNPRHLPCGPTDGPPRVPPSWGQGPVATRWAPELGAGAGVRGAGPAGGTGSLPRTPSLGCTQGAPGQDSRVSGPFGFCILLPPPPTALPPAPQTWPSPAKCIRMPATLPAGTSGPTEHAGARWAAGACDSRRRCLHRPPFPAVSRNQRGEGPEPILGPLAAISRTRFPQEESAQPSAGGGGGVKSVL